MPVDPATAKQLVDAGGWTILVVVGATIAVGWYRKWWVPGWLYQQERAERLASEKRLASLLPALRALTREVRRDRGKSDDAGT